MRYTLILLSMLLAACAKPDSSGQNTPQAEAGPLLTNISKAVTCFDPQTNINLVQYFYNDGTPTSNTCWVSDNPHVNDYQSLDCSVDGVVAYEKKVSGVFQSGFSLDFNQQSQECVVK